MVLVQIENLEKQAYGITFRDVWNFRISLWVELCFDYYIRMQQQQILDQPF